MRISIVVSTQPASFAALAYKGRLRENLTKIKQLGFDGVELAVRDPKLLDATELHQMLAECALPVPAIGTGQAFGEEGLSLTHVDPAVRRQAVDRIRAQVRFAAPFNAHVIIGLIRGKRQPGVGAEQSESLLLESLRECASENPEVRLAIEPINRYETDLLNTVEETLRFVNRLAVENVGLLLDTFHMNIEEPSILQSIESAWDRLFHVHVADSNRWYPGAGHIDFESIVKTLNRLGYPGWLSAEILPQPDPDTAAERTIRCMRPLVIGG
jgi:sugar phosphate isomerase/epimerase